MILYLFLTCEIGYGSTNTPYYFLNLHNPLWCFETKTLLSKTGLKGKLQEKCELPKLFLILKKKCFFNTNEKKTTTITDISAQSLPDFETKPLKNHLTPI